jgi:hypothetical protein
MDATGSLWLSIWEFVEISGAIIVTVGVVGEYISNFTKLVKGKSRKARLEKFSTLVLIFGLAIELVGLVKTSHIFNLEVARANLEAKQAGTNAAASYEKAAVAEREAGQANARAAKFDADRILVEKEAEEIRSTNLVLQTRLLGLETKTSPRTLTAEQKRIILKLLFLRKEKGDVDVLSDGSDPEAGAFKQQIEDVLTEAGYNLAKQIRTSVLFSGWAKGSPPTGLNFWIKPKFNPPPQYVLDILDAFKNAQIPIESVRLQDDIGDAPLEIWVGSKPIK